MIEVKTLDGMFPLDKLVSWYETGKHNWHDLTNVNHQRKVLVALLNDSSLFVESHYLKGIYYNGCLIGALIDYPIEHLLVVNQKSRDYLKKQLGFWAYRRKWMTYRKMARHLPKIELDDRRHIHLLSIDDQYQGRGIATHVMNQFIMSQPNQSYSLFVDDQNERAIRFYLKHHFAFNGHGHIRFQDQWYGQYLMVYDPQESG